MSDCFFFLFFVRVRKLIATFDGQEILSFLLWRWCRGVYIESGCCAILPWGYFNVFGTMWTGCEKLRIWRETAKYVLTILWGNISRMLFLFYLMYRWCSMIWVRLLSYFDVNGPNLTFFFFFYSDWWVVKSLVCGLLLGGKLQSLTFITAKWTH